ncbi:MAG: RIP metalloprotease RseP [Alphaproteobacteria bacterium]|nr:RIP metalloprotease RseP [Alphaproteobacteria bacterium]
MELIGALGGGLVKYIVPFLFVLSVIVVIHELGHYWMARLFRVRIDSFSVGFGKEIFGWNDRLGTRWRIAWLPLGGYVKFHGDENPASVPDAEHLERMKADPDYRNCFHFKPLYQRALIVAAGPLANFLLAIVIFWAMLAAFGELRNAARVGDVLPRSVAERAGFEPGDLILSVDGRPIRDFRDLQTTVVVAASRPLEVVVERDGERRTLTVTPALTEMKDETTGLTQKGGQLGIRSTDPSEHPEDLIRITYGPLEALGGAVGKTVETVAMTGQFVGGILQGRLPADQLGGPVRIAQISGEVAASAGLLNLIQLIAALSISIGLINLLPIPVLDGGHLLFYAYEAVAGRPLHERIQEMAFRMGMVLILGLMVFVTINDISNLRIFGS